ncbi:DUF262 domain-containing protein [Selenomonas sp. AE3005]|uniref:DUF262 domain-containing protein n=1 Tax=Selenomonas sp. AE3005 TaxID=1485543 RepID=UPI0025E44F9F|nr:DUF262 domain-containing protein [Selenomonas sp. AE3005]
MSYKETTIAAIIDDINHNHLYLPAIQRKYIWSEEQVVKLMDSILRGYPFGTFLFWKVKKSVANQRQYYMYQFIKDYHERDRFRNQPANFPFSIHEDNPDECIVSALDGQQRLTSLFIALMGSLSLKLPRKHWDNNAAFPKKELYLDLHSNPQSDDELHNFVFLTENEANDTEETKLLYRVKDIVQFAQAEDLTEMLINKGWVTDRLAVRNINALFNRIKVQKLINYFEVESESIDDVLDIFVRVNAGGTVLSKTDLLFSTIVSYWNNGREEIDDLLQDINSIGEHYNFSNDFIMRVCLYIMNMPIALKVESFGQDSVKKIEGNWKAITAAIKDTITMLSELGFSSENIIAKNAILPVIYYRYNYGPEAFKDDTSNKVRLEIRKYLVISQLRRIFGQAANTALGAINSSLPSSSSFPSPAKKPFNSRPKISTAGLTTMKRAPIPL